MLILTMFCDKCSLQGMINRYRSGLDRVDLEIKAKAAGWREARNARWICPDCYAAAKKRQNEVLT